MTTTGPQTGPQLGRIEAARRLGITCRHLQRLAKGTPIPGARLVQSRKGMKWLYPVESIDELGSRSRGRNALVRRIVRAALDVELGFSGAEDNLREELFRSRYAHGAHLHALVLARVREVLATLAAKRVAGP